VPPKIRDLITDLERALFVNRRGRGSHRNFIHPNVIQTDHNFRQPGWRCQTVSGKGGAAGHRGVEKWRI